MASKSTQLIPASHPDIEARLLDEAFFTDPYPTYHQLHEEAPVYWSPGLRQWLVTGYPEVDEVLRSTELFSNFGWESSYIKRLPEDVRAQLQSLERHYETPTIVFSDPPIHTRLRKLVVRTFTPRALERLRAWVDETARDLIRSRAEPGSLDVMEELAQPLSLRVIGELFGGDGDTAFFLELSRKRLAFFGGQTADPKLALELDEILTEFRHRLKVQIEALRRDPDDGILSTLLTRDETGDVLTEEELYGLCLVFLTAGHETTAAAIGNAAYGLLSHPDQLELVRNDPDLAPAAFEEGIRWMGSSQRVRRIVKEDAAFLGCQLHVGDELAAVVGAADRDGRVFANPDRFDLEREGPRHLGLGWGIHFCLGAGLARLEGELALRALLDAAPAAGLGEDWRPSWYRSMNQRCLVSLPVTMG